MDGVDIAHLEEAARSAGYQYITDRMRAISDSKARELRDPALTHDQTQVIRGFLAAIERCLEIPDALRAEAESKRGRR